MQVLGSASGPLDTYMQLAWETSRMLDVQKKPLGGEDKGAASKLQKDMFQSGACGTSVMTKPMSLT